MPRLRRTALTTIYTALALAALAAAPSAFGSEKLTDNASNITLKVDASGHAVVYFTRGNRRMHPVIWGAINARQPSRSIPQVKFKIDYSGGYMKLGRPLWRTIRNRCRPYDGPALPWRVVACKAPDGSYWALQQFRRLLPNLGLAPWTRAQYARELHISHWSGKPARLDVWADWVMSMRWHELFGRLTYRGKPVYGFSSTSAGAPLDGYGRLIYLDTFNSQLGAGWKRENSFLAQRPNGRFCYLFVPRDRYAGYPAGPQRPAANGQSYRLTAGGPGVTPLTMTTVAGLADYSSTNAQHVALEAELNPIKAWLFGEKCFGSDGAPPRAPASARVARVGVSLDNAEYASADVQARELGELAAMGAEWIRLDVKWADVQDGGVDSFDWSKYDPLVDRARAHGMSVLATLAYSPTWARPAGTTDKFAPDTDDRRAAFARFAAAAAGHFRNRVMHWEIWNEPNSPIFWLPAPTTGGYAALLAATYPRIKSAAPEAFVLAGSTAPAPDRDAWIDEVTFLQGVYSQSGGRFFDGWSHHAYDFALGPGGVHADSGWHQMWGTSPSMRSLMVANGDGDKPIWATESGAPSEGTIGGSPFTEEWQATQVRQSHDVWSTYPWAGVIFTYAARDLQPAGQGDHWSHMGLMRSDFTRKPAWHAFRETA